MASRRGIGANFRTEFDWVFWPSLLAALLLSTVLPWYLGLLNIDIQVVLWALLACLVAVSVYLEYASTNPRLHSSWIRSLPYVVAILVITVVWVQLGAMGTPGFLVVYALPVIASAAQSRGWLESAVSAFTIIAVTVVAVLSDTGLRWYLSSKGVLPSIDLVIGLEGVAFDTVADSARELMTLVCFIVAIVATAMFSGSLGGVIRSLGTELAVAIRQGRELRKFSDTILEMSAAPQVLLDASTGEVRQFNSLFESLVGGKVEPGQMLSSLVVPNEPRQLRSVLINGEELGMVPVRIGGYQAFVDLQARNVPHQSRDLIQLEIRRTAQSDLAIPAFDALGVGLIIVDGDARVIFSNAAALTVFPRAFTGSPAQASLYCDELGDDWWRRGSGLAQEFSLMRDGENYCLELKFPPPSDAPGELTYIRLEKEN